MTPSPTQIESWEHELEWNERKASLLSRITWILNSFEPFRAVKNQDILTAFDAATAIRNLVEKLDYHQAYADKQSETILLRRQLTDLIGYTQELAEPQAGLGLNLRQLLLRMVIVGRDKILPLFEALVTKSQQQDVIHTRPLTKRAERYFREPEHARILVVDDNKEICRIYELLMKSIGHIPFPVTRGNDAIQILENQARKKEPIELVLLDLEMPRMNGLKVLAQIRESEQSIVREVPSFLMAEDENAPLTIRAASSGLWVTDILLKGFQTHQTLLCARIQNALRQHRMEVKHRQLLKDVLPPVIVEEYIQHDRVEPLDRRKVAVLFADIAGFTAFCQTQPPRRVVECLEKVFMAWDDIAERHQVQKIKTIGDAYMAVVGLLDDQLPNPVRNCVECAVEMIQCLARPDLNPADWKVRVGIHVGPVVAGLLGKRQFVYDLWGATVNQAARIEHHGRVGYANLSDEARAEVEAYYDGWEEPSVENMKGLGPTHIHHLNPTTLKRRNPNLPS